MWRDTVIAIKWATKEIQVDQDKLLAQQAHITWDIAHKEGFKKVIDWIEDNWGMTPAEKQLWRDQLKVCGK